MTGQEDSIALARKMMIFEESKMDLPYRCTQKKLTGGVGHNFDDNGIPGDVLEWSFIALRGTVFYEGIIRALFSALKGAGLVDALIEKLFADDMIQATLGAQRIAGGIGPFNALSQNRKLGLINLVFQIGTGKLLMKFPKTVGFIRAKDWDNAARELLSSHPYVDQTPDRAHRIARMLKDEVFPY